MDIQPGRIVEFDGELYLLESVSLDVTMQRIEPLKEMAERNTKRIEDGDDGPYEMHNPVFCRIRGDLFDPQFRSPRLKVLFPDGEAE